MNIKSLVSMVFIIAFTQGQWLADQLHTIDCPETCMTAFNQVKKFARNGSPHAQTLLGLTFEVGKFTNDSDNSDAWRWMNMAKSQSFPPALYHASHWYRDGYHTQQDVEKSNELLSRSASLDYKPALYEAAIRSLHQGLSKQGMEYLERAADLEHVGAVALLQRFEQLNIKNKGEIQLDDSALAELLPNSSVLALLPIEGQKLKPGKVFITMAAAIKDQALFNTKGTTGSHLGHVKCGEAATVCRVIRFDDDIFDVESWVSESSSGS